MGKWTGLTKRITARDAEAEPERERLFSQPPRSPSPETSALLARINKKRKEAPHA